MSFLRGFAQKKESQGVKDFLTGGHQPWLPCEIDLILNNIREPLDVLCEVFDRAGYNRTRSLISKKRGNIARQLIAKKEKKIAGPKPEEINPATMQPYSVTQLSDAEIEHAKGRAQSEKPQPLVGEKRESFEEMKLLRGTIVLTPNRDKNQIRFHFSENGKDTDCNHISLDAVISQGTSREDVAIALRELADRIENL